MSPRNGILLLVALCLFPPSASAARYYVKPAPQGNDSNPGLDWAHPKATVAAAIGAAAAGDEIWVAAGTYPEHVRNATDNGGVSIDVALFGGFSGTETSLSQRDVLANRSILDGGGGPKPTPPETGSVILIGGGAGPGMRVDGFTITGGHAYLGGGIQIVGSAPTIVNNYIKDNDADAGGGVFITNYKVTPPAAHPVIDNNVIALNYAGDGGGIAVEGTDVIVHLPPVAASITSNLVEENVADYNGGGIGSWGHASLRIANNRVRRNAATYDEEGAGSGGGGIFATADDFSGEPVQFAIAAPTVVNNVVAANAARKGAGILLIDYPRAPDPALTPPPKVTNNTIVANNGAGIGWANDFPAIANNVVAFNAWGLQQWNVGSNAPVIRYNNVYGNSVQESQTDYDGTADATGSDGNLSADPMLANREIGDVHLQPGSPCLDAGNAADVGAGWTDMDGQARVQGGGVDIGADESDGTTWNVPTPVYYVSPAGDNTTGRSWATAKGTVQGAIQAASITGGEVWVAEGTYAEHISIPAYVYLYGGFAGSESNRAARDVAAHPAVLDGGEIPGVVRIVNAGYRASALDGFTVQNGGKYTGGTYPFPGTRYGGRGGGIYSKLASPSIANNTIRRNSLGDPFDNANKLGYGAGIFLALNYSRIVNNLFAENETLNTFDGSGGGIHLTYSRPTIEKNTFTRNQARYGPAVYGWGSAPVITGNVVDNNAFYDTYPLPLYFGAVTGAIDLNLGDDFRIEGNTIRRNRAAQGAGIHVVMNSDGEIRNNLVYGNVATDPTAPTSGMGGGIYASVSDNSSGILRIVNNTVTGNTAGFMGGIGALGGGIAINVPWPLPPPDPLPPGKMVVANNIFAYNSSGIFRPPASQLDPTLLHNDFYNGGLDNANIPLGATDIHAAPAFVDNTTGDFRLLYTSPCVDAGDNASVPTDLARDFVGNRRVFDGNHDGIITVDLGAFEFVSGYVRTDFERDGKDDFAVWRPSEDRKSVKLSGGGSSVTQWGDQSAGDIPVSGDFDGDGRTDVAVWRPSNGTWYVKPSSGIAPIVMQWGDQSAGDIPVPGDYDGDGKTDFAVWRPSNGTWYVKPSLGIAPIVTQWGDQPAGDTPVPGDYDGDGRTDVAVWRPSNGTWYAKLSSGAASLVAQWGDQGSGDRPVNRPVHLWSGP